MISELLTCIFLFYFSVRMSVKGSELRSSQEPDPVIFWIEEIEH